MVKNNPFFYPKDNTPGCTKEACSFSDNIDKLKKKIFMSLEFLKII